MNYRFNQLSQRKKVIIIGSVVLITIFYAINRHYLRPYVFSKTDNEVIRFIFNVLPNFIGIFPMYLATKYFLNYSLVKNLLYVVSLATIYEYISGPFDIYDVLTSVVAAIIIYIYEKLITIYRS